VVGIWSEEHGMSQDKIEIKDLLLRGIVGVNDWERETPQDILINITLFTDLHRAGASDDINDTVNYRSVTKKIIELVEASQRYTVEALAADIARICLEQPGVQRVRVRLEKPGALRFARSVGVEIERQAEDFA
jgi:FolB domain-containing protein